MLGSVNYVCLGIEDMRNKFRDTLACSVLRSLLLWVVSHRMLVPVNRRFGTTLSVPFSRVKQSKYVMCCSVSLPYNWPLHLYPLEPSGNYVHHY